MGTNRNTVTRNGGVINLFCLLIALFGIACLSADASDSQHAEIENCVRSLCGICTALDPSFSPDGNEIAYRSNLNGNYQVWIVPAEGGYPRLVTNGDASVHGVQWSPVERKLVAFGLGQGELESQLYVVHPDGTGLKLLTPVPGSRTHGPTWTVDGKYLYGFSNARAKSFEEPCFIDPRTGDHKWLMEGRRSGRLLSVSRDGKYGLIEYFTTFNDGETYLLDIENKKESPLMPNTGSARTWGMFAPDSRTIYLITNAQRERIVLARTKIASDGKPEPIKILSERPDADLIFRWERHTLLNPAGTQAVLLWSKSGDAELELLDLTSATPPQVVPLPAGMNFVDGMTYSPDGKLLALALSKDLTANQTADDIWLMDTGTKQFRQLTFSPHPGVDFAQLVQPTNVTFKTFDGLELTGCVYKPLNRREPCAYVIDFHGGPEGTASPTCEYQPFLEQGIGVFAPNIRGSGGRGKAFAALDDGALRANAVKDIKSCVDYLISAQSADPSKIGVMGHSAGGYLSMSALTDYPELFAAGIEDSGPIDLIAYVRLLKSKGFDCTEFSGPVVDEKMLASLSPAFKSDHIKAPFLMIQGANDASTPEADEVAKKLKQRAAVFEYVVFADEGHNMDKTKDKIKYTTAKVEFLLKYLKP
jgi:dipeptidyl aminopeptidase/acylaminoacyl peptidase